MPTTVSVIDAIYDEAWRIAFESRRTLGEVINELLAAGLKQVPDHRRARSTRERRRQ